MERPGRGRKHRPHYFQWDFDAGQYHWRRGLSGSGLVCDPNVVAACNNYPFADISIWTQPGGGPLTLTFPVVSGVGTFLENDAEPGTPFSASLAVYAGATLLGTVMETSDSRGDLIYPGATDMDGANITSATYSLTVAGNINWHIASYSYSSYDCNAGNVDGPLCRLQWSFL